MSWSFCIVYTNRRQRAEFPLLYTVFGHKKFNRVLLPFLCTASCQRCGDTIAHLICIQNCFWWSFAFFVGCCYGATIIICWVMWEHIRVNLNMYIYAVNYIIALHCIQPKKENSKNCDRNGNLYLLMHAKHVKIGRNAKKTFYFPNGLVHRWWRGINLV